MLNDILILMSTQAKWQILQSDEKPAETKHWNNMLAIKQEVYGIA